MSISLISKPSFVKNVSSDSPLPPSWSNFTYAPGSPIYPLVTNDEGKIPRSIDYPISVNASLVPRIGYGLLDFGSIATAYNTISEVSMPVNTTLRKIVGFSPRLVDSDENEVEDHPMSWMTRYPDGSSPFDVWLTRFLKCSDIFDAGAFFKKRDNAGNVVGMSYVDGSTLFIIVDETGNVPKPNQVDRRVTDTQEYYDKLQKYNSLKKQNLLSRIIKAEDGRPSLKTPAYTQVIQGTPFAWYAQDELWYKPRSRRYNAPYGETYIEQAWAYINIVANITSFELAHYREGNMPEGWWESPEGWTTDRVMAYELAWNARMTNGPTERMRSRFAMAGMKWHATKKPDFPHVLYQRAFNNIIMSYGYPPSEFGELASKGLGGKDLGELMSNKAFSDGVSPRKVYIENAFNDILDENGYHDVRFQLTIPAQSTDPNAQRDGVLRMVANGLLTINEGLGILGYNLFGGEKHKEDPHSIGNKHLIIQGGKIFVLEDMMIINGEGKPSFGDPAEHDPNLPAEAVLHEPQGKADFDMALQIMREGKLPNTPTYSIGKADYSHDHSDGSSMIALLIPSVAGKALRKYVESMGFPNEAEIMKSGDMHLTLAHFPNSVNEEDVLACIDRAVLTHYPSLYGCRIQGIGIFERDDGKRVFYASLDHPRLPEIRQAICDELSQAGINFSMEHGFVPHITLAYVPAGVEIDVNKPAPDLIIDIDKITYVSGNNKQHVFLRNAPNLKRTVSLSLSDLRKHCGVCAEDDEYLDSPLDREVEFYIPGSSNSAEIVSMSPAGLPPKPAVWKPEGSEMAVFRNRVGGPLFVREEATYLIDRSLGFFLVPLTYTHDLDGEMGAAQMWAIGADPSRKVEEYSEEWAERAGILDYITCQLDRNHHNWLTHPTEKDRMILIDNGIAMPVTPESDNFSPSPFSMRMSGKEISDSSLSSLSVCLNDVATWSDLKEALGERPVANVKSRISLLINSGSFPYFEEDAPLEGIEYDRQQSTI